MEGKLAWGHRLHILNAQGEYITTVKQVVLSFLPRFELYLWQQLLGTVRKEFTFLKPSFSLDFNGWNVKGNFWEWDYSIRDLEGNVVAVISKDIWR